MRSPQTTGQMPLKAGLWTVYWLRIPALLFQLMSSSPEESKNSFALLSHTIQEHINISLIYLPKPYEYLYVYLNTVV